MRILILKKDVMGIVCLKNIEHYLIPNVEDFNKISDELYKARKDTREYKYCEFGNDDFIPFYMRIKDRMFNQMATFEVERVRYSDLNLDEAEKETMIKKMIADKNLPIISDLENKGLKFLLRRELGEDTEDKLLKIGSDIEILEKEVKECNYKKYLDELV